METILEQFEDNLVGNHPLVQFFEDYGPYAFEIFRHLEVTNINDIVECSRELMHSASAELYHLPEGAEILFHYGCAQTAGYQIGYLCFFRWHGVNYVAEQNAGPMIVWRNRNA